MEHRFAHSIEPKAVARSRSHEGRFGRLFGKGFAIWSPPGLGENAQEMAIKEFARGMFSESAPPVSNVPVGYTYLGQFIDHDITFDPLSSLGQKNDPDRLQNFRTPRFDLDSVYGRGPDDQPYMYDQKRQLHDGFAGFFKLGEGVNVTSPKREPDLQRNADGVAIIGDPRNDENVVVSQLQLAFYLVHNNILARLAAVPDAAKTPGKQLFDEAQRITTWLYQYVVWNDFVRRLVPKAIFDKAIEFVTGADGSVTVNYGLKDVYDWSVDPFMPVEFSAAAYRFGHSMIRAEYQLNIHHGVGPDKGFPIFSAPKTEQNPDGGKADLRGGHPLRDKHSLQWDWYLQFATSFAPAGFPQMAHKIDTHLSQSVFHIPEKLAEITHPLAELNIKRGWRMELPPASEVARALNITPLPNLKPMEESLWVYVLKEAEEPTLGNGEQLGPVGGTIVAAVFSGLLRGDGKSFINRDPTWSPDRETINGQPLLANRASTEVDPAADWELTDIIRLAGLPEDGDDIDELLGERPQPPTGTAGQAAPAGAAADDNAAGADQPTD